MPFNTALGFVLIAPGFADRVATGAARSAGAMFCPSHPVPIFHANTRPAVDAHHCLLAVAPARRGPRAVRLDAGGARPLHGARRPAAGPRRARTDPAQLARS